MVWFVDFQGVMVHNSVINLWLSRCRRLLSWHRQRPHSKLTRATSCRLYRAFPNNDSYFKLGLK